MKCRVVKQKSSAVVKIVEDPQGERGEEGYGIYEQIRRPPKSKKYKDLRKQRLLSKISSGRVTSSNLQYLLGSSESMAVSLPSPSKSPPRRPTTSFSTLPELSKPFLLDSQARSYRHQYSNIYFVRLVELRPIVEERALERWDRVRDRLLIVPIVSRIEQRILFRQTTSIAPYPQPTAITIMLHSRDCLPGYATEAERSRRYGARCGFGLLP